MNSRDRKTAILALIALLEEDGKSKPKAGKKPKSAKAKKVWTDKKGRTFQEAKESHYAARQNRWANGKAASSGMTADQRRELAATLPYGYSTAQWNKAAKAFKAANGFI